MLQPHRFLPLLAGFQRTVFLQTGKHNPALGMQWRKNTSATFQSSSFNQLETCSGLQNSYYALRHGQSKANVAGVIASDPKIATVEYGLSDLGKEQATNAGQDIVKEYSSKGFEGLLILSSDFLRAMETAECASVAAEIEHDGVVVETRLRERYFGKWDLGSDHHYNDVWIDDAVDPSHTINGVESVQSVVSRTTEMILEWDQKYTGHMIICVAHGDVLQILQSGFSKMDYAKHRSLEHLETATLRKLELKS
ncbi:unnamed protein product [Cylindrotheca closterium]|uniref:Phosphoglycerate mutase n=1 Tax=Cylindrotheca closterium TaxID=2856 RepID=A0AAD2CLN2_9STRA|nr:unnamed protein product [Cylindrotheca closterium]